jgi:hypothetical protein
VNLFHGVRYIICCRYRLLFHACCSTCLTFHCSQIQHLMQFVRTVYQELPNHMTKIFEPRPTLRVKDLSEINIEALLTETYTITTIQSEKKTADGTVISVSFLLRCVSSVACNCTQDVSFLLKWIKILCALHFLLVSLCTCAYSCT